MDADELYNWIAFDQLQNKEYRDRVVEQLFLEKQAVKTDAEKTSALKSLLDSFLVGGT